MKQYCRDCKKEQIFDTSYDDECLRCSECGCLPYHQKRNKKEISRERQTREILNNLKEIVVFQFEAPRHIAKEMVLGIQQRQAFYVGLSDKEVNKITKAVVHDNKSEVIIKSVRLRYG